MSLGAWVYGAFVFSGFGCFTVLVSGVFMLFGFRWMLLVVQCYWFSFSCPSCSLSQYLWSYVIDHSVRYCVFVLLVV